MTDSIPTGAAGRVIAVATAWESSRSHSQTILIRGFGVPDGVLTPADLRAVLAEREQQHAPCSRAHVTVYDGPAERECPFCSDYRPVAGTGCTCSGWCGHADCGYSASAALERAQADRDEWRRLYAMVSDERDQLAERGQLPSITDGITDFEAEASATFDLTIDEVRTLKADRDAAIARAEQAEAERDQARAELDETRELLHSIWLYVKWQYVTKQLTTGQKDLWADAVDAISRAGQIADGEEPQPVAVRWWRDDDDTEDQPAAYATGGVVTAGAVPVFDTGCTYRIPTRDQVEATRIPTIVHEGGADA